MVYLPLPLELGVDMLPAPPIDVLPLLPKLHQALLDLLESLNPAEWELPSPCAGWSVKDLAAHLWGDDLGLLARKRDGYTFLPPSFAGLNTGDWESLVSFINYNNTTWVEAARRLSPQIIISLLRQSGPQVIAYLGTLDPQAIGEPVHWAGSRPAPVWLDLAREYTERWMHQQHIRQALKRPGLLQEEFFLPLLDSFARALPHGYRHTQAEKGATVTWSMEHPFQFSWTLQRREGEWMLFHGKPENPTAQIELDGENAWRLFTRGIPPAQAAEKARITGDQDLALPFFNTVSILA
jgi:uncharacterized protein (TIGR03083 family)